MAPDDDTRVHHYIAELAEIEHTVLSSDRKDCLVISRRMDLRGYMKELERRGQRRRSQASPQDEVLFRAYARPLAIALRDADNDGQVLLAPGDNRWSFSDPIFVKSRPIASPGCSVLFPLNTRRHFRPMQAVESADVPFESKAARIVWRGGTTGRITEAAGEESPRAHVFDWIDRNPRVDVAFSNLTPRIAKASEAARHRVAAALRPPLGQAEQLRSRYLLSLEGNDVASGLKWMLLSNSVVMMPQPTMETWACEAFLKPMVHYVPVAPDLSDLEERLEASTQFVRMFLDAEREAKLCRRVMDEYTRRVSVRSASSPEYNSDSFLVVWRMPSSQEAWAQAVDEQAVDDDVTPETSCGALRAGTPSLALTLTPAEQ